jgi:hypothetical protein
MVIATDVRINSRVQRSLNSCFDPLFGDDVLVEAKLATGSNHPAKLAQSTILVSYRAEHERDNSDIERLVFYWQFFGNPADNADRGYCGFRLCLTELSQSGLRLNGNNLGNRAGVVPKVLPVAGPNFNHPAGDARKQAGTVFCTASPLATLAYAGIDPSEDWMMDRRLACFV